MRSGTANLPLHGGHAPRWLWERVGLDMPSLAGSNIDRQRVDWIDSRPWFIPALEEGEEPFAPMT